MLEPNPKMRAPIEEVIKHSWVEAIDVLGGGVLGLLDGPGEDEGEGEDGPP